MPAATLPPITDDVFASVMSPAARLDPYPFYEAYLARRTPIEAMPGLWFVFTYDECLALLRDRRTSVDEHRAGAAPKPYNEGDTLTADDLPMLIHLDPPDHTRLRRLVQMAFTPRRIDQIRRRAEQLVHASLQRFTTGDTIDVIAEVALPVPLTIISEMLGVEPDRADAIKQWSTWLARSIDPGVLRGEELNARIDVAASAFLEEMLRIVNERRRRPGDDLLSQLVVAEADGDRLTEPELLGLALLLLVAGHETTVNLVGNGLRALLDRPDQFRELGSGLAVPRVAVNELLRFDSPVQMTTRMALEPIDVGGVTIPTGHSVVLMLGAANHDPHAFDEPGRLNLLTPRSNAHLAFGNGIHHCLGAALARAEGEVALSALTKRFPGMTLAAEPAIRPTFVLRGRESLLVTL